MVPLQLKKCRWTRHRLGETLSGSGVVFRCEMNVYMYLFDYISDITG